MSGSLGEEVIEVKGRRTGGRRSQQQRREEKRRDMDGRGGGSRG